MNINSVYDILNNSSLNSKENNIDKSIDYLREQISILANKLDYSKYKKLVDNATNISNTSKNYIYNFNTNTVINEGIYKIYGLLAIYLKIKKILNINNSTQPFDIISKINEEIESDLKNFDSFFIKPYFMNDKLRDVNNSDENNNQVYMFNNEREGLEFKDREITNSEDEDSKKSMEAFQQKKQLYDVMTDYINYETVYSQGNQELIFNFQYLVNSYYNKFLEEYIKRNPELKDNLRFLYKGGTTMGILFEKYNKITNDLYRYEYGQFFKRSDSDYSLQLQNNLGVKNTNQEKYLNEKTNFNLHYYKLVILNYNLCQKIKKMIILYADYILPFKIINNEDKIRETMEKLDEKVKDPDNNKVFEKIESVVGIVVDKSTYKRETIPPNTQFLNFNKLTKLSKHQVDYTDDDYEPAGDETSFEFDNSYRKDFYVTKTKNNHPVVYSIGETNSTPLFYYCNETNYFTRNVDITNFNLSRIKYNFIIYMKLKSPINGINYCYLNVPAEIADIPIPKYNDFKTVGFNLTTNIKTYKHIKNENILLYNSYTNIYFLKDLYKALFDEVKFPWEAQKYDKKIQRIFFLLEIDLGNKLSQHEFNLLQYEFKKIHPDTLSFNMDENVSRILDKVELYNFLTRNKTYKCSDIPNLDDKKKCEEYINLVSHKLRNLTYYQFDSGKTEYADPVEHVPYLKKYLKYKNKYLNLKKMNLI
jgi:hypothetical protein